MMDSCNAYTAEAAKTAVTDVYKWTLPNEITISIWLYCTRNEQLKMRTVCRQWKRLYDNILFHPRELDQLEISCREFGKYHIFGGRNGCRCKYADIEVCDLELVISRTKLLRGSLRLEDDAASDSTLVILMRHSLEVEEFVLAGNATSISTSQLLEFIGHQNHRYERIRRFFVQEAVVNDGFISVSLLEAFATGAATLTATLKANSRWSPNNFLTDDSLRLIFRPGMLLALPFPFGDRFTIGGIEQALKDFFVCDWKAKDAEISVIKWPVGGVIREVNCYYCKFWLHTNSTVNVGSVAQIEIPNVAKEEGLSDISYDLNGYLLIPCMVMLIKKTRNCDCIVFYRNSGDRLLRADIIIYEPSENS